MKRISAFLLRNLLGLFLLSACSSASKTIIPTPLVTTQATDTSKSLPAPIPIGQMIVYKDLQVTMDQTGITASYITEYGSSRDPSPDKKFLWAHVILKNISRQPQNIPIPENFSVLFGTTEFKPSYGHRKDHAEYTSLNAVINQEEELNAWLRFDIPANAELKDLTFAFLPESTQVSFGFSFNEFFWADHPIYLWACDSKY